MVTVAAMRRHPSGGLGVAAAVFLGLAAPLSGCMQASPPGSAVVPVVAKKAPAPSARQPPAVITSVTVGPDDTLYSIARANDVPIRDLIESNGLAAPYDLKRGQVLRLPPRRIYVVAAGDTVYRISRRFGVDMTALMRMNAIAPPYTITVGERLTLPASTIAVAQSAAPAAPAAPAAADSPSSAGATVEAVPLPPPASTAPQAEPGAKAESKPSAGSSAEPAKAEVAPKPKPTAQTAALTTGPHAAGRFVWPLRGKIVSVFGAKRGGEHNDGINIAAKRGEPVRAAADGTVIYAGNELRGFGNLILLKHAGGWTTAYAHNDALLVANGAQVKRGQMIAKAGSTGNVSSPQLHFEIRRGTRAVNPADYLTATAGVPAVSRVAGRAVPPDLE